MYNFNENIRTYYSAMMTTVDKANFQLQIVPQSYKEIDIKIGGGASNITLVCDEWQVELLHTKLSETLEQIKNDRAKQAAEQNKAPEPVQPIEQITISSDPADRSDGAATPDGRTGDVQEKLGAAKA